MVCFPNSDNVTFSREFTFCLFINYAFINYAYICTCIGQYQFSGVSLDHVVWNGETKPFTSWKGLFFHSLWSFPFLSFPSISLHYPQESQSTRTTYSKKLTVCVHAMASISSLKDPIRLSYVSTKLFHYKGPQLIQPHAFNVVSVVQWLSRPPHTVASSILAGNSILTYFLKCPFCVKRKYLTQSVPSLITVWYVLLLFPYGITLVSVNLSRDLAVVLYYRITWIPVFSGIKAWRLLSFNDFQFVYHKRKQFWRR